MRYQNKNIIVMAEICSTGLWRKGKGCICGNMIGYDELDLPEKLIKELKAWINKYDDAFYKFFLGKVKEIDEKLIEKINIEAYRIVIELKKLFPDKNILLYQENNKGNIEGPLVTSKILPRC